MAKKRSFAASVASAMLLSLVAAAPASDSTVANDATLANPVPLSRQCKSDLVTLSSSSIEPLCLAQDNNWYTARLDLNKFVAILDNNFAVVST